ncbi:MAG: hypothetical protein ACYDEJ_03130 [Desulfitobacteriaceae bacterium]
MAKSLKSLTPYYENILSIAIHRGGYDESFGPAMTKATRPLYNRIVESKIGKVVTERGPWYLEEFALHIVRGEFLATQETLLWYILDQYKGRDQILLETLCNDYEPAKYHREEICNWLRGLSTRYPELISFWGTHDLNVININE